MGGPSDRHMKWKPKRMMLYAQFANDVIGTAGADTGQSGGGPVVAVASGASAFGVVQINAQNDEVTWWIPIPHDYDVGGLVLGRVFFIHASTDADTPIFTVKSTFLTKTLTVVDMDTADDESVAFSAHTCSTNDDSLEVTNWTDLQWDESFTENDVMVGITCACTNLGSASADEIELIGLEIMYDVAALNNSPYSTDHALMDQPV